MAYGQQPTPHSSPSLPLPCLHRLVRLHALYIFVCVVKQLKITYCLILDLGNQLNPKLEETMFSNIEQHLQKIKNGSFLYIENWGFPAI